MVATCTIETNRDAVGYDAYVIRYEADGPTYWRLTRLPSAEDVYAALRGETRTTTAPIHPRRKTPKRFNRAASRFADGGRPPRGTRLDAADSIARQRDAIRRTLRRARVALSTTPLLIVG